MTDFLYPPLPGQVVGGAAPTIGDVLYYDGTTWKAVSAGSTTGVIRADGTVAFTANESMGGFKLTSVGAPTAVGDAVNKGYVDQIPSRAVSGAITVAATDIGGAIHATGAGAQDAALPDLSASLIAGKDMVILFVQEGAATQVTITPAGGTINGAATLVLTAGYGTRAIVSRDGLNWFA